jgi:SAM-dependent methyltransferase
MSNELTNRNFWAGYWEAKKGLAFRVPANYFFHRIIKSILKKKKISSAIELGGFPGYYAIFLKKHFDLDTSLFDFYIHPRTMQEVLEANGLTESDIDIIEGDIFSYSSSKKYDMVLSFGLIEHFNDTKDIISRHVDFLKPGGELLITLPNFTGLNGWLQRKYDPENYKKHNIESMNPKLLEEYGKALGLKNVKSFYYGKFSVWLENRAKQPAFIRLFVTTIWTAGQIASRIIPIDTKYFSPHIVLTATK